MAGPRAYRGILPVSWSLWKTPRQASALRRVLARAATMKPTSARYAIATRATRGQEALRHRPRVGWWRGGEGACRAAAAAAWAAKRSVSVQHRWPALPAARLPVVEA